MTTNDENIHIGEFLKQIISYWRIYVPIGLICLMGAIVFLLITPKEYDIIARVQLLSEKQGMMSELKMLKSSGLGGLLGGGGGSINTEDEIFLMQSRENLISVIKENDLQIQTTTRKGLKKIILDNDESPLTLLFPPLFLDTLNEAITVNVRLEKEQIVSIKTSSKLFNSVKTENHSLPYQLQLPIGEIKIIPNKYADGNYKIVILPLQYVYEELVKTLDIRVSETISNIVALSQKSSNKKRSQKLLNSIMKQYNLYSRNVKVEDANLNASFVKNRLDTITMELSLLEYQIEKYKQSNKMPDLEAYATVTYYGNKETEKLILETETRLRMIDYVINYMQNPENRFSAIPVLDETGEKSIAIYNQLLLERQRLLMSSEANNPALQLAERQLIEQQKMLLESVKSIRENIQISLDALYKKDNLLTGQVDKLPKQEREFIEMKRQQKIKETIYLFLMQKLQEKELVNSPDERAARIVDKAYASYKHVFPRASIILIIAFVLSVMLSLIVISLKIFAFNKKTK